MIRSIGWVLLLILPIVFMFSLILLDLINQYPHPAVAVLFLVSLLQLQLYRGDHSLVSSLQTPNILVFSLEYYILMSPIISFMLSWGDWINVGILILGIPLVSLFSARSKSRFFTQFGKDIIRLPIALFEWRIQIRRQWPIFLLLYVLGVLILKYPVVLVILVMVLAMLLAASYEYIEDKELVELLQLEKGGLLWQKTKLMTLYFHGALLPHYTLFLVVNGSYWYLLPVVALVGQLIILFGLCYKYANYHPDYERVHNQLSLGLFMACFVVPYFTPFLAPAAVVWLIILAFRAQKRLTHYYA
ncbi:MAG: hypothetical protein MK212_03480 [Saprospiraceae bacterium]|nr:hypothetical protein [Saprospiraceae bacterium]